MMRLRDYPDYSQEDISDAWLDDILREVKDRTPAMYMPMLAIYEEQLRAAIAEGLADFLSRPLVQAMVTQKVVDEYAFVHTHADSTTVADLRRTLAEGVNILRQHYQEK